MSLFALFVFGIQKRTSDLTLIFLRRALEISCSALELKIRLTSTNISTRRYRCHEWHEIWTHHVFADVQENIILELSSHRNFQLILQSIVNLITVFLFWKLFYQLNVYTCRRVIIYDMIILTIPHHVTLQKLTTWKKACSRLLYRRTMMIIMIY